MGIAKANCPACAGPVEFRCRTSLVSVCPQCRCVVGRKDRRIEDHGRVAALVDTQSPLRTGLSGRFRGKPFQITGRVQYQHPAGGVWDEWYCRFPNEVWGWLSEAQGNFYLTFARRGALDAVDDSQLEPGSVVKIGQSEFTVAEVNDATIAGAEGEIPGDVRPGAAHSFADLYGSEAQFATLELSEDGHVSSVFQGWQVSLAELGLDKVAAPVREAKTTAAMKVSCPKCAGPLELRAPDQTQRVSCPYCNSLLDCADGGLRYLSTMVCAVKPLIELGKKGTLDGVEYTVIGFMQRSVTFDKRYFWTEYLLYNPAEGFRWLVHSDDHWSFVKPVPPSEVKDYRTSAVWNSTEFKLFQKAVARVEYVLGEFCWKVSVGEKVDCRDMIAPPYMLSFERSTVTESKEESGPAIAAGSDGTATATLKTKSERKNARRGAAGELTISLGRWMPPDAVEQAFQVSNLPRSFAVAPNQPSPCDRRVYGLWGIFALASCIIFGAARAVSSTPDPWLLAWALFLISALPVIAGIVNFSFDVKRWSDSEFSPYSTGE